MSSSASAPPSSPPTDPAASPLIASVVPLVPAWRVDRTFDYVVPAEARGPAADRITRPHPFRRPQRPRRRSRPRACRTAIAELEQIGGIVLGDPVAPPPLNDLIRWLARRYVVPAGKAFARVVPPGCASRWTSRCLCRSNPAPSLVPTYTGGDRLAGRDRRRVVPACGVWSVCRSRPKRPDSRAGRSCGRPPEQPLLSPFPKFATVSKYSTGWSASSVTSRGSIRHRPKGCEAKA